MLFKLNLNIFRNNKEVIAYFTFWIILFNIFIPSKVFNNDKYTKNISINENEVNKSNTVINENIINYEMNKNISIPETGIKFVINNIKTDKSGTKIEIVDVEGSYLQDYTIELIGNDDKIYNTTKLFGENTFYSYKQLDLEKIKELKIMYYSNYYNNNHIWSFKINGDEI